MEPKRRRKFEMLLADIRREIADPGRFRTDRGGSNLSLSLWGVTPFIERLVQDCARTQMLLKVARELRQTSGPGQMVAEQEMMEQLASLARHCANFLENANTTDFSNLAFPIADERNLPQPCQVLLTLRGYALECLHFSHPHDSFAGRRRALAFEILGSVGAIFDIPEALAIALKLSRKLSSRDGRAADEFLVQYLAARDSDPVADFCDAFLKLADRTPSRTNAAAILDALFQAGQITETEAATRLERRVCGY